MTKLLEPLEKVSKHHTGFHKVGGLDGGQDKKKNYPVH